MASVSAQNTHTHTHTCCLQEGAVEAEREQRLFQVPQEVFEDAGDDVEVVHLAEQRDSLAAQKLLLQLLHLTISTGQTVQTHLRGGKKQLYYMNPSVPISFITIFKYIFNIVTIKKMSNNQ